MRNERDISTVLGIAPERFEMLHIVSFSFTPPFHILIIIIIIIIIIIATMLLIYPVPLLITRYTSFSPALLRYK